MSTMYGMYEGTNKIFFINPVVLCVLFHQSLSQLGGSAKYGIGKIGAHWTTTSYNSHVPLLSSPSLITLIIMHQTILTCPPVGATGKVCKHNAVVQKTFLLEDSNCLCRESNLSLSEAQWQSLVCVILSL
jgi:hypothetical protein